MRSRNSLGEDNLGLTPSSLSGSPVQFKSSLRAGLPVPASSRCLFLFPRHGHAQGTKTVQEDFLTIAAGHCRAPEPEPWPLQPPAGTLCTALGLGTWSTSQAHRWRWRGERWHQLISRPKGCQDLAGTKAKESEEEVAERWYNCFAEYSHNGSCNHRENRVSVWNTISALLCKYRNYDFMSHTSRGILSGLFSSISEL